jgi:hypothetical protein
LIEMPLIEINHIQSTSTTPGIFWRSYLKLTKQVFRFSPQSTPNFWGVSTHQKDMRFILNLLTSTTVTQKRVFMIPSPPSLLENAHLRLGRVASTSCLGIHVHTRSACWPPLPAV